MKKLRFNNTYDSGVVTFLVFPNKKKYIGVCLEFDLVVQEDTLEKAMEQIKDYAKLWHKNAVKHKLSEEILNRPAPKKYWKLYADLLKGDELKLKAEITPSIPISFPKIPVTRFQHPYPYFNFA